MNLTKLLMRILKWFRERFHGPDVENQTLTRRERRMKIRRFHYSEKYSGRRVFTKAPSIHLPYNQRYGILY